jgi:hypothetical protein
MSRIFGSSTLRFSGSRKSASTVACEKSAWYMSPWTNVALSATPAAAAFFFDSSTRSGLYSTPTARAPRFAAAMTLRPSPEPRSITTSFGVTLARSSMRSTISAGVGTHTTSLPA